MSYILHYPERPIVTTQNSHYISNDKLPAGGNTIVAIMTNTGYNQEDGVIINKTSIDRGLFQITGYKSYSAQESSVNKNQYTMFVNPLKLKQDKHIEIENMKDDSNYQLLDERGIALPESFVTKGSKVAIIGMVEVKEELKEIRKGVKVETNVVKTYRNASVVSGVHHYGTVDKIYVDHTGVADDHNRICKMRFRKIRRPELGDKICSRHGQKGVIGMIIPEEDMPFTKDGIVPDIIINPHAIPSRMTIGHLVECVLAKTCTMDGAIGDGSVFIPLDLEKIGDQMETHEYERYGNEVLYNGRTGEQIHSDIFIGPTFYLRLKHMVADKMNHRSTGPREQLTHQPTSGRGKEGGLRIGEMERDVLLSYGFSQFAKESMMERSDKYTWGVCRSCGRIAAYAPAQNLFNCVGCAGGDIAVVQTPYAFKLLIQELEIMGITPRLVMDEPEFAEELAAVVGEEAIFEETRLALEGGSSAQKEDEEIPCREEEEGCSEAEELEVLGGESSEELNDEVISSEELNNEVISGGDEDAESLMDSDLNIMDVKGGGHEFVLKTDFSDSDTDIIVTPPILEPQRGGADSDVDIIVTPPILEPQRGGSDTKIIDIQDSKWSKRDAKDASMEKGEDMDMDVEDDFE